MTKAVNADGIDYTDATKTQGAYPTDDDLAFISKVQGWWDEADKAESDNISAEKDDHAFTYGHQWAQDDIDELAKTKRVPLVINKVRPTIQVVGGHKRSNRMRVRYLPVEMGDSFKADTGSFQGLPIQWDQTPAGSMQWRALLLYRRRHDVHPGDRRDRVDGNGF